MSEGARCGIAQVSLDLLTQLLHLPQDHKVKAVHGCGDSEIFFAILVEGPTLPETAEGEHWPSVRILCAVEIGEPEPSRKITCTIEPWVALGGVDPARDVGCVKEEGRVGR